MTLACDSGGRDLLHREPRSLFPSFSPDAAQRSIHAADWVCARNRHGSNLLVDGVAGGHLLRPQLVRVRGTLLGIHTDVLVFEATTRSCLLVQLHRNRSVRHPGRDDDNVAGPDAAGDAGSGLIGPTLAEDKIRRALKDACAEFG